jgi:phosphoglycerate-specific signal transduction histidine kinase
LNAYATVIRDNNRYMHKSESDAGKAEQIRRMHEDNDKKTQALLREGRREMQREIEARRKTEEQCRRLEAEVNARAIVACFTHSASFHTLSFAHAHERAHKTR